MRSCSTFRRAALAAALLLAYPVVASAQDSSPADCSAAAIPDAPFAGWIDGSAFAITDAEIRPNGMTGINGVDYDAYQLILGTSGMSDVRAEVWVSVIVQAGTQPDGRAYRMRPQDSVAGQPEAGPGAPSRAARSRRAAVQARRRCRAGISRPSRSASTPPSSSTSHRYAWNWASAPTVCYRGGSISARPTFANPSSPARSMRRSENSRPHVVLSRWRIPPLRPRESRRQPW